MFSSVLWLSVSPFFIWEGDRQNVFKVESEGRGDMKESGRRERCDLWPREESRPSGLTGVPCTGSTCPFFRGVDIGVFCFRDCRLSIMGKR